MSLRSKIAEYKRYGRGVCHCTFNPGGPGVVRIHLVPPKFRLFGTDAYVVILNGYYILPIGSSWAMILAEFIDQVAVFDGKPIGEEDERGIIERTVKRVCKLYPSVSREDIELDLCDMLDAIFTAAKGEAPSINIERLSIRKYAKRMTSPHRMDLMVSAMTDGRGKWQCNQKCKFCYAAGQCLSGVKELTTDEWKNAIDKLKMAGVPMLTFTGGEPTIRNDLVELVDYSKWFVTRLNTNGVALTTKLATALRKASLDSVQITLYSHDEATHNSLVGSEHWADTVEGIKNAVAAGLDVSVNTPLCILNKDYLNTVKFIKTLGVRFVTVSGLICTGGAEGQHQSYDLSEDQLCDAVFAAKEYCDEQGMEIDFTSPGLISKYKLEKAGMKVPSCGAALSNMAIAPDGTVIPCQSWLASGSELGNILTDDFGSIWNHTMCRKLRSMNEDEAIECPFRNREGASK